MKPLFDKKSQTATEYLIILAVVIIIAIVVTNLLGGFPGIGGGVSENAARTRLRTLEIGINAYAMTSRATMFRMQNNNAFPIMLNGMEIEGKKCSLYPNRQRLEPGQEREIICFGVVGNERGARFSRQFTIDYTDLRTNALYTMDQDTPIVGQMVGGTRLHTGQQGCYQGSFGMTGPVDCTSVHAGQDGYEDGTAKDFTEVSSGIVLDRHTGLEWTRDIVSTGTDWYTAVSNCSSLTLGGGGWRLPNIVELTSVLSSGSQIVELPFTWNDALWLQFWTNTTLSADPNYAFKKSVGLGAFHGSWWQSVDSRDARGIKTDTFGLNRAVCIRGDTLARNLVDSPKQFVDNGDGTVIDLDTGLIWEKVGLAASSPETRWNNSVVHCNNQNTGGFNDWRLPTISEGVTLIDYSCPNETPSHCTDRYRNSAFDWLGGADDYYWTGTTWSSNPGTAYVLDLDGGRVPNPDEVLSVDKPIDFAVRCVRDLS